MSDAGAGDEIENPEFRSASCEKLEAPAYLNVCNIPIPAADSTRLVRGPIGHADRFSVAVTPCVAIAKCHKEFHRPFLHINRIASRCIGPETGQFERYLDLIG
jgi:hypothetical protein